MKAYQEMLLLSVSMKMDIGCTQEEKIAQQEYGISGVFFLICQQIILEELYHGSILKFIGQEICSALEYFKSQLLSIVSVYIPTKENCW